MDVVAELTVEGFSQSGSVLVLHYYKLVGVVSQCFAASQIDC